MMRFSLKRTLLGVLLMVTLQLTVYYWIITPERHPRTVSLPSLPPVPRQQSQGFGTCEDKLCPQVREDALNVHIIAHSHDDVGWLKTPDQYYTGEDPQQPLHGGFFNMDDYKKQCVRCILNTTISELTKNPQRKFIFIEMYFFQRFWDESNSTTRALIQKLIRNRQLEIALGGWVMSDAAVTYYNDIIDQHTLGFDFIQQTLGPCAQSRVGWHVDQFGHSREHAAILAKMGFDGLFVGRVDYQDHDVRKNSKKLEFLWDTSPNAPDLSSYLFTQLTFDGYYSPHGFNMDDVKELFVDSNTKKRVTDFVQVVRQRADSFRTKHLLLPMGSDFGYKNATEWFHNIDILISLVKESMELEKGTTNLPPVNVFYSTPSCYLKSVHDSKLTWEVRSDDLHPYAITPGAYWTGYFTSRGGQKFMVKQAGTTLQACKQLGIFARLKDAFNRTDNLRKAMAVMQHHDAITGTEKQHVANEYNRMVSEGMFNCQSVISDAYKQLLTEDAKREGVPKAVPLQVSFCLHLNVSECPATENLTTKVLVLAYNPLSRPVLTFLRFPVTAWDVSVRDYNNQRIPSQILPVPDGVIRVPERKSESDNEVVFAAKLPPMGYSSFVLENSQGSQISSRPNLDKNDVVIENKYLRVTFDSQTGRLKELLNLSSKRDVKLSQDFAYYRGVQGGFRSSGAYVFVPERELPSRVGAKDPVHLRVYKGDVVQEVHQQFSSWVSQVVRLYKDSRRLELQWTVGPIPTMDRQGKEVVSFFVSDLKTENRFYTDSNGREILERRLNHRDTWNLTVVDPISGNYYPVASRLYIQDKKRDTQLTLLPDRPQGGSSLYDGTMELMVHRRLLFDDGLGVGEPLDERGVDEDGIIYTGKHYLFLDTIFNSAVLTREMALNVHLAPTFTFLPLTSAVTDVINSASSKETVWPRKSFLSGTVPTNIQVLTLDYTYGNHSSVYLLRLEHIYEKKESPVLSEPASVSLKNLFSPFEVTEAEEVSLGGNFSPASHERLQWTSEKGRTNTASVASPDYKEVMTDPFTVKLQPMEIRTFRVFVSVPKPNSFSLFFS